MATIEDPKTGMSTDRAAQREDVARRYRDMQPQGFRLSSILLPVGLIILAYAHVVGWQVSQIDPAGLVRDAPKMGRIITQLVQPDLLVYNQTGLINAQAVVIGGDPADTTIAPPTETAISVQPQVIGKAAAAPAPTVAVPDAGASPVVPATAAAAALATPATSSGDETTTDMKDLAPIAVTLKIEPGVVIAERPVTVTGHIAFPANYSGSKDGTLIWKRGMGDVSGFPKELTRFTTDGSGNFTASFVAPDSSQVEEENTLSAVVTWGVGNQVLSPTLVDPTNGVLFKILETILQALMGTTFAVFISLPLSFFAARNIMGNNPVGRILYYMARTILNALRSIEVLIMATIFVAAVGIGPFAGVLALVLHSVASLGKLYSEAIESIDPGPIEAITATGAGRLQTIVFAIIPQFIPQFVSFTLYRWDVNVRMSTIIGFVGGGGIGFLLTQYINLLQWHQAGTAIWTIAIVVIAIDLVSARIRQAVI